MSEAVSRCSLSDTIEIKQHEASPALKITTVLLVSLYSAVLAPSALSAQDSAQSTASPADSEKPLSGHVNKSDSLQHIVRPASGQNQPALNSKKSVPAVSPSYDFSLAGKAQKQEPQRKSLFEAGVSSTAAQRKESLDSLPALDLAMEESTDAGLIRWNDWHRQFVENLYLRFHRANNGDYPGSCRILVSVDRDGDLDFAGGDDYQVQSSEFKSTLNRSIRMIAHSGFLRFPDGSQRSQVRFTMSIRSSKEQGEASFGWTQGDTEVLRKK